MFDFKRHTNFLGVDKSEMELHVGVRDCPRVPFLSGKGTLLWEWTGAHNQCTQCWVMTVTQ